MKQRRPSLDGFVPRRASSDLGGSHTTKNKPSRQTLHTGETTDKALSTRSKRTTLGTSSIRTSLEAIDSESGAEQSMTRQERRRLKKKRNKASKKHRIIKRIIIAVVIILLAIGVFLGIRAFINMNHVFQGDLFGLFQKKPLKEDENGRSNFLIYGTEAPGHPGANLTDSIMVLSVNQTTKDAYMISIPRDLWVDYGGACPAGYQGKINEVYSCGSDDGENQPAGAAALRKKVGSILGLDLQYYIHLNFKALQDIVDAVDGVTVTIESNPKGMGILDRNFDWECGYKCHYVKYEDGETVELDGKHALALARARNAQGGYGLSEGNFDREKNQQKIIKALREKALNVGTLTNLGKVTSLMDALGNNFKTNVEKAEIQTLMALGGDLDNGAIKSLTLVDKKAPLVTTGNVGAASVVQPSAGLYNYSDIQAYIAKNSTNNPVTREDAKIVVLNGTAVSGVAGKEADALKHAGYVISATDDAPDGKYAAIEVYKIGEGKTATTEALEKRYSVTIQTTPPPITPAAGTSFVVVVGKERS